MIEREVKDETGKISVSDFSEKRVSIDRSIDRMIRIKMEETQRSDRSVSSRNWPTASTFSRFFHLLELLELPPLGFLHPEVLDRDFSLYSTSELIGSLSPLAESFPLKTRRLFLGFLLFFHARDR